MTSYLKTLSVGPTRSNTTPSKNHTVSKNFRYTVSLMNVVGKIFLTTFPKLTTMTCPLWASNSALRCWTWATWSRHGSHAKWRRSIRSVDVEVKRSWTKHCLAVKKKRVSNLDSTSLIISRALGKNVLCDLIFLTETWPFCTEKVTLLPKIHLTKSNKNCTLFIIACPHSEHFPQKPSFPNCNSSWINRTYRKSTCGWYDFP